MVAADQLSLAIGRGGQNVRLAAKLTGWKLNIQEDGVVAKEEGGDDRGERVVEAEGSRPEEAVADEGSPEDGTVQDKV